jgi:hypothetical protein
MRTVSKCKLLHIAYLQYPSAACQLYCLRLSCTSLPPHTTTTTHTHTKHKSTLYTVLPHPQVTTLLSALDLAGFDVVLVSVTHSRASGHWKLYYKPVVYGM